MTMILILLCNVSGVDTIIADDIRLRSTVMKVNIYRTSSFSFNNCSGKDYSNEL